MIDRYILNAPSNQISNNFVMWFKNYTQLKTPKKSASLHIGPMRIAALLFVFNSLQPDDLQKIKTNLHSEKNFVGATSPISKKEMLLLQQKKKKGRRRNLVDPFLLLLLSPA